MDIGVSRFAPETSAIVVVDVQNDFCDPEGLAGRTGHDVSEIVEMVPRLERLLDNARNASMRVVFVKTTHDEMTDSPVWLARKGGQPAQIKPSGSNCRTGTWGAEFYRVAPEPHEPIVIKHRYSAFAGTSLDIVLRTMGITSLLFTGATTEVCVESSLREALFHDYHVTLIEDCCASFHSASHAATVNTVRRNFGLVVKSGELIAQWGRVPAPA
jgi:ureidoacrylate peracid hydrolase